MKDKDLKMGTMWDLLKEVGVGVSPRSTQAFINVTMTCVLPKCNQNLLSLPIHRVIFCGQKKTQVNLCQAD